MNALFMAEYSRMLDAEVTAPPIMREALFAARDALHTALVTLRKAERLAVQAQARATASGFALACLDAELAGVAAIYAEALARKATHACELIRLKSLGLPAAQIQGGA